MNESTQSVYIDFQYYIDDEMTFSTQNRNIDFLWFLFALKMSESVSFILHEEYSVRHRHQYNFVKHSLLSLIIAILINNNNTHFRVVYWIDHHWTLTEQRICTPFLQFLHAQMFLLDEWLSHRYTYLFFFFYFETSPVYIIIINHSVQYTYEILITVIFEPHMKSTSYISAVFKSRSR